MGAPAGTVTAVGGAGSPEPGHGLEPGDPGAAIGVGAWLATVRPAVGAAEPCGRWPPSNGAVGETEG